ncbi:hypothetical protein BTB_502p02640 (plasmid) [Bacillus thuringiensis Bt407]|uniref:Uncharacterized protein n=1 Tax=Bacillus thuringiensis T01-328 TaxID=1324966 RepID=A0AAN4KQU4_BACTU|nr:hypothetical protein BTB_502p02640 [Bacillus thuringiensis Bt407]ERI01255.1 hypothetical protein BTCBT_002810 [Bacillus thuringiensis T01-328]
MVTKSRRRQNLYILLNGLSNNAMQVQYCGRYR